MIPAGYRMHNSGWYYKTETGEGPFFIDALGNPHQGTGARGELTADAWGVPKVSIPHSSFHGLFTFDIPPSQWFLYHGVTQVYTSTVVTSVEGAAVVAATAAVPLAKLESRYTPRYQPNRGELFSTALWCPNKLASGIRFWGMSTVENGVYFELASDGKLYANLKSLGTITRREEIDTSRVPGFDVERGNVYDIQYQWLGVGNYVFFINLVQVHVFANLGTLTALSMADPALPAFFESARIADDVQIKIGCVDISSENGSDDRLQYSSVYATQSITGTNKPLVVIHNPLQINGQTNTRMVELARISLISDKKCVFKVWMTRDPSVLSGGTLQALGQGSFLQMDSPDAVATAVPFIIFTGTVANTRLVTSIPVQANQYVVTNNPLQDRIDFALVRGDYLVVTTTVTSGACEAVVELGEAI